MKTDLFRRFEKCAQILLLPAAGSFFSGYSVGAPALPDGRNVGIGFDSGGVYLTLPGIQDATYEIEGKSSISDSRWEYVGGFDAIDGLNVFRPPTISEPTRFFRVLFPQPALAAGEPAFLSSGTSNTLYITGEFFYAGDRIRVGGILLDDSAFVSSTMLRGTLPALPPGLYDIEVISGHNGDVLAVLHNAVEVAPSLERTLQEPPEWPPAGPASALGSRAYWFSKKGYDYYKAASDSSAAGAATNPMFQENSNAGEMPLYESSPGGGGGHVTVLKAHDFFSAPGGGHVTVLKARDSFLAPGGGHVTVLKAHLDDDSDGDTVPDAEEARGPIAGIAVGAIRAAGISPGGGHVTVLKYRDNDGGVYGDTRVRLHSGEVQQQVADLAVAGRGLDFAWVRTYRSRTGADSPQGTRWSHSYDVRCEQDGDVVFLYDGTGRKDAFRLQADGSYVCPGFFREGAFDGSIFRLTFADTGFWEFNPIDAASPASGKLARIQDRNGNAVTCVYDEAGRLLHVVDTLGRTNSVAYTPDNRIASVTDCTGRTVTYAYYAGESGGNTGDLKSVTSPPVTGTPNGNDFPDGKAITYTYSSGQADIRANHLLLTITDALGQSAVTCVYDLDPASGSFQRCVSLRRAAEQPAVLTYLPQTPSPDNGFAAMRCIVNDPAGNVTETFCDLRNRCVAVHQYTGRAEPGAPVTASANRPEGKLRTGDPDRYETLLNWNNDSLCTRVFLPGGSTCRYLYAGDSLPATRARKRPDLLSAEWDARATGGADTDGDGIPDLFRIVRRFTYDPRFSSDPTRGGNITGTDSLPFLKYVVCYSVDSGSSWCSSVGGGVDDDCDDTDDDCDGFATSVTDPRGTVTAAVYDERGNLTRVTAEIENGPVVDFAYNAYGQRIAITNAPDTGGLRRVDTIQWVTHPVVINRDAGNNTVTSALERDVRGNVTRYIDPNGNDTLFTYNALDQLIAISSPPYGEKGGQRVNTFLFYDANNNIVQVDTDNRFDTGDLNGINPSWTTRYEYDALNRCVATIREATSASSITNRFEYDANGRLASVISPLAVSGVEPQNRIDYQYDERDLLFRAIEAPGSDIAATTEWAYTPDGDPASVRYADNSVAVCSYDGFSRRSSATDANGNTINWFFNGAGDLTVCRVTGEIADVPGSAGNRRLGESRWVYDGIGRCTQRIDSFFDVFTELAIDGGSAVTRFAYAPIGQYASIVREPGETNSLAYDTVGRLASVTGPRGDIRLCVRDANGNVTRLIWSEVSDLSGSPQQFTCDYSYDGLDRRISAVDSAGNTNRWFYDSRDLLVRAADPRGNEVRYLYDGLHRSTGSISYVGPCDADKSGTDRGITINTSHVEYDANSRVVAVTDVNTNRTTYAYDARDRVVLETCPDGTARSLVWSPRSNLVREEDACGTVILCTYDALGRLIRKDITPGSNVVATTTFESFVYDGLSRCVAATNDVSGVSVVYDSLGNQRSCIQDGTPVLFTRNIRGDRTSITYPSGITVDYTYDTLHQVRTVSMAPDGQAPATLATFDYDGPGRLARVSRVDGTSTDIIWNGLVSPPNQSGDHGWRRMAAISHGASASAGGIIDERVFGYDRDQNKILRAQTEPFDPAFPAVTTNMWEYDALGRLRSATRVRASATLGDITVVKSYVLDGKGNRIAVTNNAAEELYVRSAALPPADFQMDQYTRSPSYGILEYDDNGRLTGNGGAAGRFSSRYDYADRLVQVDALGAGGTFEPLVSFGYDAFGRRISKTVHGSGGLPPETTYYLYDGVDNDCDGTADDDDILETYAGGNLSGVRIYGHGGGGEGVSAPPLVILVAGAGGAVPYFTRCDDLGNVLALTDAAGAVLERYAYGDFGDPQFLAPDGSPLTDAVGTPVTASPAGNPYLFHGMQWEGETGLYLDQHQGRYYNPLDGHYTTRGDIGGEPHSRAFAGNNPWTSEKGSGVCCDGDDTLLHSRPVGTNSTRAQDHNSSRSNKTRSSTRARDYNSSRSNTTSLMFFGDDDNDPLLRKRPGRVKYGDITLKRGLITLENAKRRITGHVTVLK